MEKKSICKWLAMLGIGAITISTPTIFASAESYTPPAIVITNNQEKVVTIVNPELNNALKTLLGKSDNENFYVDDFLNHENYKPTTSNEGGVEKTTALNYQLDLSNTGVKNIIELVKFEFPSTLQGINLAGNGITNQELEHITTFLSANTTSGTVTIGNEVFEVKSNFSTLIKKVNLNANNIDLPTLSPIYLENEKLIFGIQNIENIHSSGLVLDGEINPYYYIRKNSDENYLTFDFKYALSTSENSKISIAYNQVTNLLSNLKTIYGKKTDKISLEIKSVPESTTAYFKDYNFKKEFINFKLSIDPNFKVERTSIPNLNISSNGQLEEGSPVIIEGFGDNSSIKLSHTHLSTSFVTSETHPNKFYIIIEKDGLKRSVELQLNVVDTIKPVIKLIGTSYAYSSQNKEYNDPGVIAYDPSSEGDETGDDLTQLVVKSSNINITTLGVYTITYTVSDHAGNTTTITRSVEIQERALDKINLRINSTELKDGSDIILSIQPDIGVDISNYENIKYYWYINNNTTPFQETLGDSATGASTITIIGDSSTPTQIYVKMIATQKTDNATIELYSDKIDIIIDTSLNDNDSLILAAAIAVLSLIVIISIVAIVKYSKGKRRTHYKKKTKQGKELMDGYNDNASIQVFKNTSAPTDNNGGEDPKF